MWFSLSQTHFRFFISLTEHVHFKTNFDWWLLHCPTLSQFVAYNDNANVLFEHTFYQALKIIALTQHSLPLQAYRYFNGYQRLTLCQVSSNTISCQGVCFTSLRSLTLDDGQVQDFASQDVAQILQKAFFVELQLGPVYLEQVQAIDFFTNKHNHI